MKNNTNTRKNHIPGVHILSEKTRKTILMAACTASLFALLSAGSAYAAENSSENTVIGAEAAQNYAFADAGVDPVSASSVFTEYDYDDGQFVYEVEFTAEGTEYEYQIQAYDGSVLKKSTEYVSLINSAAASANADTSITLDKAKEIALNDAELVEKAWNDETSENSAEDVEGSSADLAFTAVFTKEKSDYESGVPVYEIEFYTDNANYEYEISAVTGDIFSISAELHQTSGTASAGSTANNDSASDAGSAGGTVDVAANGTSGNSGSNSTSSGSCISVDDAKAIALEKAGASASEVTFKKAKLDKEDGILVYEVEFYFGQTEYECTLNATTGEIIEFEAEWDD